jgi:hypothetical protein
MGTGLTQAANGLFSRGGRPIRRAFAFFSHETRIFPRFGLGGAFLLPYIRTAGGVHRAIPFIHRVSPEYL